MHHQIYGFAPKKIPDQQNPGAHFVMLSSAEKKYVQQKSWGKALNQQKSTTQNQKMSSAEP